MTTVDGEAHTDQRTIAWVLDNLRSMDDPTWPDTFDYIEANHLTLDPDYWEQFCRHVDQHGVLTPVVTCQGRLWSGHHRIWALRHQPGRLVPVLDVADTTTALELTELQAADEQGWQSSSSGLPG